MRRFAIVLSVILSLSLLAGCAPGIVITSPKDEELQREFQEDWKESIEDWKDAWDGIWDGRDGSGAEKDHYWKILDVSDEEAGTITEAGTVTDKEKVEALDDLLSDDGSLGKEKEEDPGNPAYSYVYCQEETLKAGQDPEEREYEELVRFTVSAEKDVVTMVILEDLPSLLNVDLGDFLTFTYDVPAETAEALRDPARFLE